MAGEPDPREIEARVRRSEPLAGYEPWRTPDGRSPQADLERSTAKVDVFRGGNRSGKTKSGSVKTSRRALNQDPFRTFDTVQKLWVVCRNWEMLGGYLWPAIKEYIPDRYIAGSSWLRRSPPEIPLSIKLHNGNEIAFKSADASPDKFAGDKIDFAWVDEEIPGAIMQEVRARLIDKDGDLLVTFTPVRSLQWLRDLEREPGTAVFRASTIDNPYLPQAAVQAYAASLSDAARRRRLAGEYGQAEGLVYPQIGVEHFLEERAGSLVDDRGVNRYPWPLPPSWRRVAAIDFGYVNPFVFLLGALDPDQRLILYQCLYGSSRRITEWAAILKDEISAAPSRVWPIWSDHDAGERAELDFAGVPTEAAKKDIVQGIERVHDRLHIQGDGRPRVYFCMPALRPLVDEAELYQYPEQITGRTKDIPIDKDNHALDALRYAVMGLDGGPPAGIGLLIAGAGDRGGFGFD